MWAGGEPRELCLEEPRVLKLPVLQPQFRYMQPNGKGRVPMWFMMKKDEGAFFKVPVTRIVSAYLTVCYA